MRGKHLRELCHPIILLIHLSLFFSPLGRLSFVPLYRLRLLLLSWWASVVLKWSRVRRESTCVSWQGVCIEREGEWKRVDCKRGAGNTGGGWGGSHWLKATFTCQCDKTTNLLHTQPGELVMSSHCFHTCMCMRRRERRNDTEVEFNK